MAGIDQAQVSQWANRVPTRTEIALTWAAVADGSLPRETAHAWTVPWVEGDAPTPPDPRIYRALQSVHGLDMTYTDPERPNLIHHGPPGTYLRSLADVAAGLREWQSDCAAYDADPHGWVATRVAIARSVNDAEARRRAGEHDPVADQRLRDMVAAAGFPPLTPDLFP